MLIRLLLALSICLAGSTGYLLHARSEETKTLRGQIHTLEVKAARMEGECEKKIALLKAEVKIPSERSTLLQEKKPLAGLFRALTVNPGTKLDETLAAMREALRLDSDQIKQIMLVLDTFSQERSKILTEASKEKTFVLNPRTTRLVGEARQRALEKTKAILTVGQYEEMVEKGYDVQLGLRVATPQTSS